MTKWILRSFLSPGDALMLTAAVRDLHVCFPGEYLTDVRTPCPGLWENNPYITPLSEGDEGVEVIDCHYPLIQRSNQVPVHFIHGYIEFLNERIAQARRIRPTAFRGDVHLSDAEKSRPSTAAELIGQEVPYWILVAGGKYDYTIKWWHFSRFQSVVDAFEEQLLFVQVGEAGHFHPQLEGVIDLRGRTDLRQLMRLVFHAQGVLCPVTFLMHLAAALERPCVVVAGGREPPQWEAYPIHQFIHTVGALSCCATGGCWKSRTVPLGDGDPKDAPECLCLNVVNGLPRCMDLITPLEVARRIELFLAGGTIRRLTSSQFKAAQPFRTPRLRTRVGIGTASESDR